MSAAKNQEYEPNIEKLAFGNLLFDIARAVRDMPGDQYGKFVKGELRLTISFEEKDRPSRPVKPGCSSAGVVPERELQRIRAKLDLAQSREDGHRIVLDAFPERERLFAFAGFLDLPVRKGDKAENVREKIVAFTVGRRLSGEAIRGGFTASSGRFARE